MRRSLSVHILKITISLLLLGLILAAAQPVFAQAVRIIFLHHSTGHALIEEGGVREGFTALGYEFYDHGYNGDGLRLADGTYTGTHFDVPGDNTDPDGFAEIFAQSLHVPPDNTFSYLMQYDVIAFKSCFPTSNIGDDAQLAEYKDYYLSIRDRMDEHPEKIFIVFTPPPQVPGSSDSREATRARAFADWLGSDEYLDGHPNVFTFDFFDLLAGGDNFLRSEYRYDNYDGHPNEYANEIIGPRFVDFVDEAIRVYDIDEYRPAVESPVAPEVEAPDEPPPAVSLAIAGLIDDFESGSESIDSYGEGSTADIECLIEGENVHGGSSSLRFSFDVSTDGWGDCGRFFDDLQDWSVGEGISLWLQADTPSLWLTLTLFSGDYDAPTPFETHFEVKTDSVDGWASYFFPWSDFSRAVWADPSGITELDEFRMQAYVFSVGSGEGDQGTIWIDDVSLAGEGIEPIVVVDEAAPTPPEPEPEAERSIRDLCPFSTIALPLIPVAFATAIKKRKKYIWS